MIQPSVSEHHSHRHHLLETACRTGDQQLLAQILTRQDATLSFNDDQQTLLHLAASSDTPDLIKPLLDMGADVDARDKNARTALHLACLQGHFRMAKSLVEQGSDPDLLDHLGHAPIHLAILNRHLPVCSLFLAIKTKLETTGDKAISAFQLALNQGVEFYEQIVLQYYGYELIDAIYDDNLTLVNELTTQDLAKLAAQRFKISDGLTNEIRFNRINLSEFKHCITLESLLHIAIKVEITSQIEMIKYLLEKGVRVSEKNVRMQTSLHLAVEKSNIECAKILTGALRKEFTQFHANLYPNLASWINSSDAFVDTNNETPLHYAARSNNGPLCDLMLSLGFELSSPNINLQYPHDLCTLNELKSKLLRRFKEQEIMVVKSVKTQLLLEACKSGDLDVVKVNSTLIL